MNSIGQIGSFRNYVNQTFVGRVEENNQDAAPTVLIDLVGLGIQGISANQGERQLANTFSINDTQDAEVTVQVQVFEVTDPTGTMPDTTVRAIIVTEQTGTVSVLQVVDERTNFITGDVIQMDVGAMSSTFNITSYVGGNGLYLANTEAGDCLFRQFYRVSRGNLREIPTPTNYLTFQGEDPCP